MISLTSIVFWLITSIYNLSYTDVNGTTQPMTQFQGKKILLVNIATESSGISQLTGLQQLHQQYGDSLIVIAFPSNSFGKEPRSNAEIKQFCETNYGTTFRIASKVSVTNPDMHPIYHWLTNLDQNGVNGSSVIGNFQKFLISKEGNLIGTFSGTVDPLNQDLVNAILEQ